MSVPTEDGWEQRHTIHCDGCRQTSTVITTVTDQPDPVAAGKQLDAKLRHMGWAVSDTQQICPTCRKQAKGAGHEHYVRYANNESGVQASCSCGWVATSPAMPGAQLAVEAHRATAAIGGTPPSRSIASESATAKRWWE